MKMKKRTWFIIIGIIILVIGLMIYLNLREKRPFNTFEFPETLTVQNHTENERGDTVAMVILNKLLGYDTMNVNIYPMPAVLSKDSKTEYIAMIKQVPFQKGDYIIFLQQDASIGKIKMALSHEMVHLKQFEDGRLDMIPGDQTRYIWLGDTIRGVDVKYEDRTHEKEAFREGPKLERELNKILYK
jgi:hypothetical protein